MAEMDSPGSFQEKIREKTAQFLLTLVWKKRRRDRGDGRTYGRVFLFFFVVGKGLKNGEGRLHTFCPRSSTPRPRLTWPVQKRATPRFPIYDNPDELLLNHTFSVGGTESTARVLAARSSPMPTYSPPNHHAKRSNDLAKTDKQD